MAEAIAKTIFPSLYAKIEKKKQAAMNAPLSQADINTLRAMHFNNQPVFPSIDMFYSEAYRAALANGTSGEELDKIPRYRAPSSAEVSLLFCDLHIRDDKLTFSGTRGSD